MRIALLLIGVGLFATEDITLTAGCDGQAVPTLQPTPTNTVSHAAQAQLSDHGMRYLSSHAEDLIGLAMPVSPNGWVEVAIPDFDTGDEELGAALSGLVVSFNAREVDLDIQFLSNPNRLHVIARRVRMRVEQGVVRVALGGDIACNLLNDSETGLLIDADFVLDLHIDIDDQAQLQASLEMLPFHVEHLGFDLVAAPDEPECLDSPEACVSMCETGDTTVRIIEGLYVGLQERLNEMLRPLVDDAVADILGDYLDRPLFLGGQIHPRLLQALIPTAGDAYPYDFLGGPAPRGLEILGGGDGAPGDAISFTLDLALDTTDHPCVPAISEPPLFVPGPAPNLSEANTNAHLGLALSDAIVNRALWVLYRSGTLCLALDSDQLEELSGVRFDTRALSLILPGLTQLTDSPRPILVTLDPQFDALSAPRVRFSAMEPLDDIPQLGVSISISQLGFSLYARLEERWTRLFAGTVEAQLTGAVQAMPGNLLHLALNPPEVVGLEPGYNELLGGAHIPELMELVTDLASSALINDQMDIELPLDAALSGMNLPFVTDIVGLQAGGANGDYLSVLFNLRRGSTMKRGAPVKTSARALGFDAEAGVARVAVEADGAAEPRYQWRLEGGPWRPLTRAEDGVLTIREPRFRALTPHALHVRAVDARDARSMDARGVTIDPTEIHPEGLGGLAPMGACSTAPRPGGGGGRPLAALLLIGGALLWRRRRAWLALLGLTLLLSGCEDRKRVPETTSCQTSADCAGDQLCIDGLCSRTEACLTSAECCPHAECQAGQCVPTADECHNDESCQDELKVCAEGRCVQKRCEHDGYCPGGHCLDGLCQRGSPCQQRCAEDEACFAHINVCRPVECALTCPEGEARVVINPSSYGGVECDLSGLECACVANPPLQPEDFGRYADMFVGDDGQPRFVAYDSVYGDLVLVEGVSLDGEEAPLTVTYLDGAPEGPVVFDAQGPRGGVADPGPDRGRWARAQRDGLGQLHVAYYDGEFGELRYLKRDASGVWSAPEIVDQEGDVGRYVRLLLDEANQPHFVYFAQTQHEAGVRYARLGSSGFEVTRVSTLPVSAEITPPGVTPKAHGVMPCARLRPDGGLWIAFYDAEQRALYLASGDAGGFERARLLEAPVWNEDPGPRYADLSTHDLGQSCDLEVSGDGVEIAFVDQTTHAILLYRGGLAEGVVERVVEGGGIRRVLGADMAVKRVNGALVMVFQDSTDNDLWLSIRRMDGSWFHQHPFAEAGAMGFYNSLASTPSGALLVGTLEMATNETGRSLSRLWAFELPTP